MNYTMTYLTNIPMFYPKKFIRIISVFIDNDIDNNILEKIEQSDYEYIKVRYSETMYYYIVIFNTEKEFNDICAEFDKNNLGYTVKKLTWRNIGFMAKIINESEVYNNLTRIKEDIKG